MKIRAGFVSNSSSSSFLIKKKNITKEQILAIRIHEIIAHAAGDNPWVINEDVENITGWTPMDNFDMRKFLNIIGVFQSDIEWDYDCRR